MHARICEYLIEHRPEKLLWLGEPAHKPALDGCELTTLPITELLPEQLSGMSVNCAVVQDLPGTLSQGTAEALIAQLRDVVAQRILWLLDGDTPWRRQDLLALGFRQLDASEHQGLYGYDIDNYKRTPDWLSSRHWANPELWNKHRW